MNDFDNVLVNVKNSFRLLYSFNSRLLDLMKYIGKRFNLPYSGGWTKFSASSPKDGKGSLDNWAWDWLNLYLYEFHFSKEEIKFSIVFQADTGKWDSEVDYLDVDKFEKAEKTKTKLIFIFSNNEYWDMDMALDDKYMGNEYENEYSIENENKDKIYCKIFELNDFKNKKEIDQALDKYIKYLNKNKIFDITIVEEV
ncbi:hypothetical protein AGMMS49940_07310 [Spirochaetia bacterium]|nr:hypothetical protein AGMMS49940_07310 [Spirochaetia bacterium]